MAGFTKTIRLHNGPELPALPFTDWCAGKGIELPHIEPNKLNENAFIKRFNRSYRTEVLDNGFFEHLDQVRETTHDWIRSYNEERPYSALRNRRQSPITSDCYFRAVQMRAYEPIRVFEKRPTSQALQLR